MKPAHFLATLFVAMLIGIGSVFVLGRDNPVEQVAEAVIKAETGLDIDFTPDGEKVD